MTPSPGATPWSPELAQQIQEALRGLQFGAVQLVIHNAEVVRIERVERFKLTGHPEAPSHPSGRPTTSTEVRRHVQPEA